MSRKLEVIHSTPATRRRRKLPEIEETGRPVDPVSHAGFVSRLLYLIGKKGSVLALAQAAKASDSSIHLWLQKSEPSREKLVALAEAGQVNLEWLASGNGAIEP